MQSPDGENCATCRYWDSPLALKDKAKKSFPHQGTCRRRAPTRDGFPTAWSDKWCGEWEAWTLSQEEQYQAK